MHVPVWLTALANASLLVVMLWKGCRNLTLWAIQGSTILGTLAEGLNRLAYEHYLIHWYTHDAIWMWVRNVELTIESLCIVALLGRWCCLRRLWPHRYGGLTDTDTLVVFVASLHVAVRLDWGLEYSPSLLKLLNGLMLEGDIYNLLLIAAMFGAVFLTQRDCAQER